MLNKAGVGRLAKYLPNLEALYTPFIIAASPTQITIKAETLIKLIDGAKHKIYPIRENLSFSLASILDTGTVQAGKDYCLYWVPGGDLVASLNTTYPTGYDANSRKIGGLHTLCANAGTISGHPASGYVAGNIIPNSVWCLNHRPHLNCSPAGMAFVDWLNLWVDIYLQSSTGAATASAYGATITDSRTWLNMRDDLAAVGKRLLFDHEFQIAARLSNEQTNIAGSADPVTTGGHSDTAGRRMISAYFLEDMCGAMWQWLNDQSYRYDVGTPSYSAAGHTCMIYHAASPGGNPIYVKFGLDGTPYLCCNMATAAADKAVTFGSYKLVIKHDADAATGGLPLYFDYAASLAFRFLINNTITGKDTYAFSTDPSFMLILKHDASAATNGVAVNYDDGADNRMEYISPGSANATQDLAISAPPWSWYALPDSKGQMYRQGNYGDVRLLAGGLWDNGAYCGSRCRSADGSRWAAYSCIGARGCAEPM